MVYFPDNSPDEEEWGTYDENEDYGQEDDVFESAQ